MYTTHSQGFTLYHNEILYQINTVLCHIKVNNNKIELTVHTYCDSVQTYSVYLAYGNIPQLFLQVMEELDQNLRIEIEKLGGNVFLVALLDELKNWAN